MIHGLEEKSRKELVEIVKVQIEEHQKLLARNEELVKEKAETIADALANLMDERGIENFRVDCFNDSKTGRQIEVICRYLDGKSVADVLTELREENNRLKQVLEDSRSDSQN